jgi:hypothetical protein
LRNLSKIARHLDRRGLWLPLLFESHWYDRRDKSRFALAMKLSEVLKSASSEDSRRYRATALKVSNAELHDPKPPKIDLFFACAGKDLQTLSLAIESAAQRVQNPVESINVVVPDPEQEVASTLLATELSTDTYGRLSLSVDSQWIGEKTLRKIKAVFGVRFGWILQQLITTNFVLNSDANGVLVVNSDTILLTPMLFLDSRGSQILLRSSEFNPPYYKFLSSLDSSVEFPATHVTHHMMMQPQLMREIFDHLGFQSIDDLASTALEFAEVQEQREFCLEFELYAQFVKKLFPDRVIEAKFANISVARSGDLPFLRREVDKIAKINKFNSVSFHDYLG